jgi:RNA 3'-terminal phosphate cyclase
MVVLAFDLPEAGEVRVDCVDATGRLVHIGLRNARAGRNEVSFDPHFLKPGWYQVRIQSAASAFWSPLIVTP